jgi:hypothetical protein
MWRVSIVRSAATLLLVALVAGASTALAAQAPPHSLGIRQAALDYIEGWYTGDGDRVARARSDAAG